MIDMEQQQKEQEEPGGERRRRRAKTTWHKLLLRSNFTSIFLVTFSLLLFILLLFVVFVTYPFATVLLSCIVDLVVVVSPNFWFLFLFVFYFGIDFKIERRTFPDAGVIKFSYVLFACFLLRRNFTTCCVYINNRRARVCVCMCVYTNFIYLFTVNFTHTPGQAALSPAHENRPHLYFVEFL